MAALGLCLLLLALFAPSRAQTPLQALPSDLPCRFGVIGLRAQELPPDTLRVRGVVPTGPAARAGLRPGDLLLGAPPYRLRTAAELTRLVQSCAPGDTLSLLVQRQGSYGMAHCAVTDRLHLFDFMAEAGAGANGPNAGRSAAAPQVEIQDMVARAGAAAALARLEAALSAEDRAFGADCRLEVLRRSLCHPLAAPQEAANLAAAAANPDPAQLLQQAAAVLDLPPRPPDAPAGARSQDAVLGLLGPFFAARELRAQAFAALPAGQDRALVRSALTLLQLLAENPSPDLADPALDRELRQGLRQAKKVELGPLFAAAIELCRLTDTRHTRAFRRLQSGTPPAPAPPGCSGKILWARPSAEGWLLVGGAGPNQYRGPLALVIDLGGNDEYELDSLAAVSALIDLAGDDHYRGQIGGAIGGVALVADLKGADTYESTWLGQGAAYCGVGMLLDRQGDDHYEADEFSQGAALFGAGFLLDGAGRDTYTATRHSQGFGGPRGYGLLRDERGDDGYLADGRVPSSYGDAGLFEGWAQGVGSGVRGYAEGGVGLLLDRGGDDHYQVGNFGQGVGYFFGLGILADDQGDDHYLGSRYAQGAAAHQAVGGLLDHAGDDLYQGRLAASQGAAWDAAVGFLVEEAGDDRYEGLALAQGAAANNGVGLLLDRRGRDTYRATSGQGGTGELEYWGGRQAPNLGILWDGAGRDQYNLNARGNGVLRTWPELGLFEDR